MPVKKHLLVERSEGTGHHSHHIQWIAHLGHSGRPNDGEVGSSDDEALDGVISPRSGPPRPSTRSLPLQDWSPHLARIYFPYLTELLSQMNFHLPAEHLPGEASWSIDGVTGYAGNRVIAVYFKWPVTTLPDPLAPAHSSEPRRVPDDAGVIHYNNSANGLFSFSYHPGDQPPDDYRVVRAVVFRQRMNRADPSFFHESEFSKIIFRISSEVAKDELAYSVPESRDGHERALV